MATAFKNEVGDVRQGERHLERWDGGNWVSDSPVLHCCEVCERGLYAIGVAAVRGREYRREQELRAEDFRIKAEAARQAKQDELFSTLGGAEIRGVSLNHVDGDLRKVTLGLKALGGHEYEITFEQGCSDYDCECSHELDLTLERA